MQSISFCFIHFHTKCSFKRIYRIQSIKFNISTAIVGRINQNGIVKFGKICHLPRAYTALICTVTKITTSARTGRSLYPYFQNPASGETGTIAVSQGKSCRQLNLLANIGSVIVKAHQLNYSFLIFILFIYFYCAKVCSFTLFNSMKNSSYINEVLEPSAQRRRTKGEPQSYI